MKNHLILSAAAISLLAACTGNTGSISTVNVDPLYKVIPGDSTFVPAPAVIDVARGENATLQIVVTNTGSDTLRNVSAKVGFKSGNVKTGWVHNVLCYNPTHGADDMLSSCDDSFPDPIIDDAIEDIAPGQRAILWVDIAVERTARPGVSNGKICIKADNGASAKLPFSVRVYPVALPERQGLTVVQWYYDNGLKFMNDNEAVERGSDRYFELLGILAETAAEYGQNCWNIRSTPQPVLNADSTDFDLDFTLFDRAVETFIEHGNLRMINSGHFGGRPEGAGWRDPLHFNCVNVVDGKLEHYSVPAEDPRLKKYIDRYFPILQAHLQEKGWADIYYQHIADEPDVKGTPAHQSWVDVARMIKTAAPGLHTIEASGDILEGQDIMVPVLGYSIAEFGPAPEGTERWTYTCTGPQDNFANRFIMLPLIKTRLLHWINFKYDATGYLHWGLCWWEGCEDPMHNATPYTDWPSGDCYIVYPGFNKVYPCIRLCAMRDGIRDYDLLKMAEAKDPERARAICDSIILGPDRYCTDIEAFRAYRHELLEFLSE